uniref:Transmembrane protein n=1 Tax=Chromera velia CCMP2878 TaxID=1169474 RepID=A0A0K6SA13_9ALVE|eukprot:Cvel_8540.t2-p1 / transcript=Cvel_8540.t2 / gene=Cvel_8540 / organism=Chromera_velia_CCMP2878 / gene_product=hypothetical protein / transcript_product=hypothetical protein / location=Cvel_scaffold473:58598-65026(+) / protein_length=552 / sequence_SO=supercontig / SO=protein_coding / is_pseudo=false
MRRCNSVAMCVLGATDEGRARPIPPSSPMKPIAQTRKPAKKIADMVSKYEGREVMPRADKRVYMSTKKDIAVMSPREAAKAADSLPMLETIYETVEQRSGVKALDDSILPESVSAKLDSIESSKEVSEEQMMAIQEKTGGRWKQMCSKFRRFKEKVVEWFKKKYKIIVHAFHMLGVNWRRDKLGRKMTRALYEDPTDAVAKCYIVLVRAPQVRAEDFDLLELCKLMVDSMCGVLPGEMAVKPSPADVTSFLDEQQGRALLGSSVLSSAVSVFPHSFVESADNKDTAEPEPEPTPSSEDAAGDGQCALPAFSGDAVSADAYHLWFGEPDDEAVRTVKQCQQKLITKTFGPMEKQIDALVWKRRKSMALLGLKFLVVAGAVVAGILIPPALGVGIFAAAGIGIALNAGVFAINTGIEALRQGDNVNFSRLLRFGKGSAGVFVISIASALVGVPGLGDVASALNSGQAAVEDEQYWKKVREMEGCDLMSAPLVSPLDADSAQSPACSKPMPKSLRDFMTELNECGNEEHQDQEHCYRLGTVENWGGKVPEAIAEF